MQRDLFERGMRLLAATWPERVPSSATLSAYWFAMRHVDDTAFVRAIGRCIRECRFYPKPAEILERIESELTRHGLLPDDAEQAWNHVMRAIRSGQEIEAVFPRHDSYALARAALDEIGGRHRIGQATHTQTWHMRREFLERYSKFRTQLLAETPELFAQRLPEAAPDVEAIKSGLDGSEQEGELGDENDSQSGHDRALGRGSEPSNGAAEQEDPS